MCIFANIMSQPEWVFFFSLSEVGKLVKTRAMTLCPLTSLWTSVASDHFSTTTSPGTRMSKYRREGGGAGHCLIWSFHLERSLGLPSQSKSVDLQSACNIYKRLTPSITVFVNVAACKLVVNHVCCNTARHNLFSEKCSLTEFSIWVKWEQKLFSELRR